jgi:hypothetical protein
MDVKSSNKVYWVIPVKTLEVISSHDIATPIGGKFPEGWYTIRLAICSSVENASKGGDIQQKTDLFY